MKKEHPESGTLTIEKHLRKRGIKISHDKIHRTLKEGGMLMEI